MATEIPAITSAAIRSGTMPSKYPARFPRLKCYTKAIWFQPAKSNARNKGVAGRLCYGCEIQWAVRQTMFPLIIKNKHKYYQLQVNVCTYIVPIGWQCGGQRFDPAMLHQHRIIRTLFSLLIGSR